MDEDSEQYSFENHNPSSDAENVQNNLESAVAESDDEGMSTEEALQELENAWFNEKFAPELLPHESDLVQGMLQQISHMENNLKRLERGDIRLNIHTMEISRIRFIISSYLRKRLEKIEEYAIHILAEDDGRPEDQKYMTPAETRFAREYIDSVKSLFNTLALNHVPTLIKGCEFKKMTPKPNMNQHVFVRANKSAPGILIPGKSDLEVDFEEGSQHIIQYSAVAHLVKSGDVQLI